MFPAFFCSPKIADKLPVPPRHLQSELPVPAVLWSSLPVTLKSASSSLLLPAVQKISEAEKLSQRHPLHDHVPDFSFARSFLLLSSASKAPRTEVPVSPKTAPGLSRKSLLTFPVLFSFLSEMPYTLNLPEVLCG